MRPSTNRSPKPRQNKRPSKTTNPNSRLTSDQSSHDPSTNIISIPQRKINTRILRTNQHGFSPKNDNFQLLSSGSSLGQNFTQHIPSRTGKSTRGMTTSANTTSLSANNSIEGEDDNIKASSTQPSTIQQQQVNNTTHDTTHSTQQQSFIPPTFNDYPLYLKLQSVDMGAKSSSRDLVPGVIGLTSVNPFTLVKNLPISTRPPQYRPFTSPLHHHWRNQKRFLEYNDAVKASQEAMGTNELLLAYNEHKNDKNMNNNNNNNNNHSASDNNNTQSQNTTPQQPLHYDATRPVEFLGHLHALYDDTVGGQYIKKTNSSPLLNNGLTNIGFTIHSRLVSRLKRVYSHHLNTTTLRRRNKRNNKDNDLDTTQTSNNTQNDNNDNTNNNNNNNTTQTTITNNSNNDNEEPIDIKQLFLSESQTINLNPIIIQKSTPRLKDLKASPLTNHIKSSKKPQAILGREFLEIANTKSFDALLRSKKNYAIPAAAAAGQGSLSRTSSSSSGGIVHSDSSSAASLSRGYDDAAAMKDHPFQHNELKLIAEHLKPNSLGKWSNTFSLRKQLTYILPPSTHHILDTHSQSFYHWNSASDPHLLQQSVDFYPINTFFSQYLATSNYSRKMRNSILRKTALYHSALHSVDPWSLRLLPMRDRIGLAIAKLNPGILAGLFRAHFFSRFPEAEVCTFYNISHTQNIYAQIVARYLGMPCKSININEKNNTSTLLIFPTYTISRHFPTIPITQRTKRLIKTFLNANREVVQNLVTTHTAEMQRSSLKFLQTSNANLNVHNDHHMKYRLEYTQHVWKQFLQLTTSHFLKLHHFQSLGDNQALLQHDLAYNKSLNELTSLEFDPTQQFQRLSKPLRLIQGDDQSNDNTEADQIHSDTQDQQDVYKNDEQDVHGTTNMPSDTSTKNTSDDNNYDHKDKKTVSKNKKSVKSTTKPGSIAPPTPPTPLKVHLYHPDREEYPVYPVNTPGPLRSAQLPVMKYRDAFLDAVHNNQIVLVVGGTGCGKSTQLPQFIIDHMAKLNQRSQCRILTTQPRRLPCIALAERVSLEQGVNMDNLKHELQMVTERRARHQSHHDQLTSLKPNENNDNTPVSEWKWEPTSNDDLNIPVGYRIQLDSVVNQDTNLIFSTAGFVLKAVTANIIQRTLSPFRLKRAVDAHEEKTYHWDQYMAKKKDNSITDDDLVDENNTSLYRPKTVNPEGKPERTPKPRRPATRTNSLLNYNNDEALFEELYGANESITPHDVQRVRRKIHHSVLEKRRKQKDLSSTEDGSIKDDDTTVVPTDGDHNEDDGDEGDSEIEDFEGTLNKDEFVEKVKSIKEARRKAKEQVQSDGTDNAEEEEEEEDEGQYLSPEHLDLSQPELEHFWTSGRALHQQALIDYLREFSHIIIDEVHESCWATNLLITLIRDVLPHVPHLRFVLMSATLNTNELMSFLNCSALLQIEAATYPVDTYNLYDVLQMISPAKVNLAEQRSTFLRFLVNQRVMARKKLLVSSRVDGLLNTDASYEPPKHRYKKEVYPPFNPNAPVVKWNPEKTPSFEPIINPNDGASGENSLSQFYHEEIESNGPSYNPQQIQDTIDIFTLPQDLHSNESLRSGLDDGDDTNPDGTVTSRRYAKLLHNEDILPATRQAYQTKILTELSCTAHARKHDERFFLPLQSYNLDDRAQRDYLLQLLNYSPATMKTARGFKLIDDLAIVANLVRYIIFNSVDDTELLKYKSRYHPKLSKKGDAVSATQDNTVFDQDENDPQSNQAFLNRLDHSTIHKPTPRRSVNPSYVEHDDKYLPTFNRLLPFDSAQGMGQVLHPDATEEDYNYAINLYNDLVTNHQFDNGFAKPALLPEPMKSAEPLPYGSILIFASALKLMVDLEATMGREFFAGLGGSDKFEVILLHSQFQDSLERIKTAPAPGVRRIIISTSIAETSITLPDVTHVIDLGVTKSMVHNSITKVNHFNLESAVKSSVNQRRGRVGRVRPGICYRLFSKQQYENMYPHPRPETITISPVEAVFYMATLLDNSIQYSQRESQMIEQVKENKSNSSSHDSHHYKRKLLFGNGLSGSDATTTTGGNDNNDDTHHEDHITAVTTDISNGNFNPFALTTVQNSSITSGTPINPLDPNYLPAVSTRAQTSITNRFLYAFSSRMLHSISPHGISTALKVLYDAGSIDSQGKLTPMGRLTFSFPTSIIASRVLIASLISGCLEHGLTMAALIENPVVVDQNFNDPDLQTKLSNLGKLVNGHPSMLLGLAHVYNLWASSPNPRNFAVSHSLSSDALKKIQQLRRKLLMILRRQETNLGLSAQPFKLTEGSEQLIYDFDGEAEQDLISFSQLDRLKFNTLLHTPYYTDLSRAFDALFDVKNDLHASTESEVKKNVWEKHSIYSALNNAGGGRVSSNADDSTVGISSVYSAVVPSGDTIQSVSSVFKYAHTTPAIQSTASTESNTTTSITTPTKSKPNTIKDQVGDDKQDDLDNNDADQIKMEKDLLSHFSPINHKNAFPSQLDQKQVNAAIDLTSLLSQLDQELAGIDLDESMGESVDISHQNNIKALFQDDFMTALKILHPEAAESGLMDNLTLDNQSENKSTETATTTTTTTPSNATTPTTTNTTSNSTSSQYINPNIFNEDGEVVKTVQQLQQQIQSSHEASLSSKTTGSNTTHKKIVKSSRPLQSSRSKERIDDSNHHSLIASVNRIKPESILLDATEPISLLANQHEKTPFESLVAGTANSKNSNAAGKDKIKSYYGDLSMKSEEMARHLYELQTGINRVKAVGPTLYSLNQMKPFVVKYSTQLFQHVELLEQLLQTDLPEFDDSSPLSNTQQHNQNNNDLTSALLGHTDNNNIKAKDKSKQTKSNHFHRPNSNIAAKNQSITLPLPPGSNTPTTIQHTSMSMLNHHMDPSDPIHLNNQSQLRFIISSIKSLPLYNSYVRVKALLKGRNIADVVNSTKHEDKALYQQDKEIIDLLMSENVSRSHLLSHNEQQGQRTTMRNSNNYQDMPSTYISNSPDSNKKNSKEFNSPADTITARLFQRRAKSQDAGIVPSYKLSAGRIELQHTPRIPLPHLNHNSGLSSLVEASTQVHLAPELGFREADTNGAFYAPELGQAYTSIKGQVVTSVAPPSPIVTYANALYGDDDRFHTEVRRANYIHPFSMVLLHQTPQAYGNQMAAQHTMRTQRKSWIQSQERLVNAMLNERQRYLTGSKLLNDREDDYGTLFAGANLDEDTPEWLIKLNKGNDDDDDSALSTQNQTFALDTSEQQRLNSYLYRINQVDQLDQGVDDDENGSNDDAQTDQINKTRQKAVLNSEELEDFIQLQIKQFESDFRTYTPQSAPTLSPKRTHTNKNNFHNNEKNDIDNDEDHPPTPSRDFGGPDDIVNHILWDLGLDSEHDRTLHLQKHGTKPYFDIKYENELKLEYLTQLKSEYSTNTASDKDIITQKYQQFCSHLDSLTPSQRVNQFGRHNYNQTMTGFAGVQSNFPVVDEVISVIHASLSSQQLLDATLPTLQPSQSVSQYQELTSDIRFPDHSSTIPLEHSFVALLSPLNQAYHVAQDLINRDTPLGLLSLHATALETHRNLIMNRETHPGITMPDPNTHGARQSGSSARVGIPRTRAESLKRHPLSFAADLQHYNVTGNDFVEVGSVYKMEGTMRYIDAIEELTQEHVDYQSQNNPEWAFGTTLTDEHAIAQNLPQKYMNGLHETLSSQQQQDEKNGAKKNKKFSLLSQKTPKSHQDLQYSYDLLREFNHREAILLNTQINNDDQPDANTMTILTKDIYGKPFTPLSPSTSLQPINTKYRPIPELSVSQTSDIASDQYDPVNSHHVPFVDPTAIQNQAIFGTNPLHTNILLDQDGKRINTVQHFTPHQDQIMAHIPIHSAFNTTTQEHLNQTLSTSLRHQTFSLEQSLAQHGFNSLDQQHDKNDLVWNALHRVKEHTPLVLTGGGGHDITPRYETFIDVGFEDLNSLPTTVNFIDGLPLSSSERRNLLYNPVGAIPSEALAQGLQAQDDSNQVSSEAKQSMPNSELLRIAPEGLVASRNVEPIRAPKVESSFYHHDENDEEPMFLGEESASTSSSKDPSSVDSKTPRRFRIEPTHPANITFSPDVLTPSAFPSISTQLNHAKHEVGDQKDETNSTIAPNNTSHTTIIDSLKIQTATTNQLASNISTTITSLDGGNTNPLETPLSKQYQGKYLHNYTPHRVVSRYSALITANNNDNLVEDSYLERQSLLSHSIFNQSDVSNSTQHSAALRLAQQQYNDYIRMNQFNSMKGLKEAYNDFFYRDAGFTSTKRRFVLVSDVPELLGKEGSSTPKFPVLELTPNTTTPSSSEENKSKNTNNQLEKIFNNLTEPQHNEQNDPRVYDLVKFSSYQTRRHMPLPPSMALTPVNDHADGNANNDNLYPQVNAKTFLSGQGAVPLTAKHNNSTKISLTTRQNKLPMSLRSHQLNRYMNWKSDPKRYNERYRQLVQDVAEKQKSNGLNKHKNPSANLNEINRKRINALALRNAIDQHTQFSELLLYSPQRALQQLSFINPFPQHLRTAGNTLLDNDHDNTTSFLQSTRSLQRNSNKMKTYFYLNLNQHGTTTTLQPNHAAKMTGEPLNTFSVLSQGPLSFTPRSNRPFHRFNLDAPLFSAPLTTHIAPNTREDILKQNSADPLDDRSPTDLDPTLELITSMASGANNKDGNNVPTTNFPYTTPQSSTLQSRYGPSVHTLADYSFPTQLKRRSSFTHVGQRLLSGIATHPYHLQFYYNERLRNVMNSLQYHTKSGNELDLNHSLISITNDIGFYIDNDFFHDFTTFHQFVGALDNVELDYLGQLRPSKRSVIQRIQRLDLHDHEAEVAWNHQNNNNTSVHHKIDNNAVTSLFSGTTEGNESYVASSRRFINPNFHEDMLTRQETISRSRHLLILNKTHQLLNDILRTEPLHQPMNPMVAENTYVYNANDGHGGLNQNRFNGSSYNNEADNWSSVSANSALLGTSGNRSGHQKLYHDLVDKMVSFTPEEAQLVNNTTHVNNNNHDHEEEVDNSSQLDHLINLFEKQDEEDEYIKDRIVNKKLRQVTVQQTSKSTNNNNNDAQINNHNNTNTLTPPQIFSLVNGSQLELPPVIQQNLSEAIGKAVYTGLIDHQFTARLRSEFDLNDRENGTHQSKPQQTPHRYMLDGNHFIDPNRFDAMLTNHAADATNAVLRRVPLAPTHGFKKKPFPSMPARFQPPSSTPTTTTIPSPHSPISTSPLPDDNDNNDKSVSLSTTVNTDNVNNNNNKPNDFDEMNGVMDSQF